MRSRTTSVPSNASTKGSSSNQARRWTESARAAAWRRIILSGEQGDSALRATMACNTPIGDSIRLRTEDELKRRTVLNIRNQKDFWSAVDVRHLRRAVHRLVDGIPVRLDRSGWVPGYFPTILGILLIVLGILVALPALKSRCAGNPRREDRLAGPGRSSSARCSLYAHPAAAHGFVVSLVVLIILSAMGIQGVHLEGGAAVRASCSGSSAISCSSRAWSCSSRSGRPFLTRTRTREGQT